MDVVISTRLHGMVLALKNGVPVVAIDSVAGGAKLTRQAQALGWPVVFHVEHATDAALEKAFDYCVTAEAKNAAARCRDQAVASLAEVREQFVAAVGAKG
jgi:polysaccharide pyruvyl transferase WcaK-like protein